jgi:hypothetical protein
MSRGFPSKNAKACNFYISGFGRKMAAEKAGIPTYQIDSQLYRRDIPSHHYNKAQSPDTILEIQSNRQLGFTYQQLATKYGMSVSSMRRYCSLTV